MNKINIAEALDAVARNLRPETKSVVIYAEDVSEEGMEDSYSISPWTFDELRQELRHLIPGFSIKMRLELKDLNFSNVESTLEIMARHREMCEYDLAIDVDDVEVYTEKVRYDEDVDGDACYES